MTRTTISIAMCTFNGERHLEQQLASFATQRRLPDELVVCDDGSSDHTRAILYGFARHAPFPTRVVENDHNLGSTKNFEKAIGLCQGDFIALADQDDVWYPQKIERLEVALTGTDVVGAFSDADLIDTDSRPIGKRLWSTFSLDQKSQRRFSSGDALGVMIRGNVVTGAALAFRRCMCKSIVPIPREDIHDRWIAFLLAITGRVEAIAEPLMAYRRHHNQQIGPGPINREERLRLARTRGAELYREEIGQLLRLRQRIEQHVEEFSGGKRALQQIDRKLVFLRDRASLPSTSTARLPIIGAHLLNADYWRYAQGLKSLAKDLVLR